MPRRLITLLFTALIASSDAAILRVAAGASGTGDGSSWSDAYPKLRDALTASVAGDEIWVAAGTYYPDERVGQPDGGTSSVFDLKGGTILYGGFAGIETASSQRNPAQNLTILSADISQDDLNPDGNRIAETSADIVGSNSGYVIRAGGGSGASTIDGFTITAASGSSVANALRILRPSVTVSSCNFRGNRSTNGGAIYSSSSNAQILNCSFSGNSATGGGGAIECSSTNAKILYCSFIGNSASGGGGGGAISSYSNTEIRGCNFLSNSSGWNGGAWLNGYSGTSNLLQCVFIGNSAATYGGAVSTTGSVKATNCLFASNTAINLGGAWYDTSGTSVLTNCTLAANSSHAGAIAGSSNDLRNSIIWGNRATGTTIPLGASMFQGQRLGSCIVAGSGGSAAWNSAAGSNLGGNLDTDPKFLLQPAPGTLPDITHLRLSSGSPAINAGASSSLPADTFDLDGDGDLAEKLPLDLGGQPRTIGSAPDMGAFEAGGPAVIALPATVRILPNSGPHPGLLQLSSVFDSSAVSYSLYSATPAGKATISVNPVSGAVDVTPSADFAGVIQLVLSATDASGISNFLPLTVEVFPPALYVDADATGTATGLSWQDAFPTLQAALVLGGSGHQIWVAEGTYYPDAGPGQTPGSANARFLLPTGVSLRGGFAGNETSAAQANPSLHPTILSGDVGRDDLDADGNHIAETPDSITGTNATTLISLSGTAAGGGIDGFTITAAGRNVEQSTGCGLRISGGSPAITRCRFSGHRGSSGGAVAVTNAASATFSDCHFSGNVVSEDGGAVWCSGASVSFSACKFTQNLATYINSEGGAFSAVSSTVSLRDCEFLGNQCPSTFGYGGALHGRSSTMTVVACLFQGNAAYDAGALLLDTMTSVRFSQCRFRENSAKSDGGAALIRDSDAVVTGCEFAANRATDNGGAISLDDSSPAFTHCTLAGNSAGEQGGAVYVATSSSKPAFVNSILWNNLKGSTTPAAGNSVEYSNTDHADGSFSNCVIQHSGGSAGWKTALGINLGDNWDVDPRFLISPSPTVSTPQGIDLRLQAGSPAINTASYGAVPFDLDDLDKDGNTAEELPLDLAGKPRVGGFFPDPGAYEEQYGPANVAAAPRLRFDTLSGLHAAVLDIKALFAGSAVSFGVETQSSQQVLSASVNASTGILDITVLPDAFGTTFVVVRATDDSGRSSYHTVTVDVFPPVVFVKPGATGKANGLTWTDAFPTLQAALAVPRIEGITLEIWVAQGVQYPDQGPGQTADSAASTFRLPVNCRLYGGFAGGETQRNDRNPQAHPTILSGDLAQDDANGDGNFIAENTDAIVGTNALTIVNADASRAGDVLDGFVITAAGDTVSYNGTGLSSTGGTLSVQGCSFQGNRGILGGAVRVANGSATISACRFTGNLAGKVGVSATPGGAAAYLINSSVTMQDCYFASNRVIASGGGGAIGGYGGGSLTLARCVFDSNTSENEGGSISVQSIALSLTDCRFSNSTTTDTSFADGGAVYCENAPATIVRCTFEGNRSGGFGGGALAFEGEFPFECRDTRFSGNSSDGSAGAVSLWSRQPVRFTNCLFAGNSCPGQGGAIYMHVTDAIFTNCTFTANRSGYVGGAIFEDDANYVGVTRLIRIRNSILWANEAAGSQTTPAASLDTEYYDNPLTKFEGCIVANSGGSAAWNPESGVNAGGNRDIDPHFLMPIPPAAAPSSTGNFQLAHGSPALDTGDNALVTATTDLAGAPRITNTTVDLGAYEGQNDQLDADGDGLSDAFELSATTPPSRTALASNADTDLDGLDNRLEFLFGLDPRHADLLSPQQEAIVQDGGSRYLALRYRRNAWALQFFTVEVERSLKLGLGEAWATGNTTTIATTPLGGNVDEVTVRSNFPIGSQRAEFLRIRATP